MVSATNEQLEKIEMILQQLDYAPTQKAAENRRNAARMNLRIPLNVIILSGIVPAPVDIFTRNLSVSGLGFVSRRLFKSNERIAVKLQVKGLQKRLILARVTFGRYVTAGLYEMGAEFLESINDNGRWHIPSHWQVAQGRVAKQSTPVK